MITGLAENTRCRQAGADLWLGCGARIREMTPAEHDGSLWLPSAIYRALAFALVDEIAAKPNAEQRFRFVASGF